MRRWGIPGVVRHGTHRGAVGITGKRGSGSLGGHGAGKAPPVRDREVHGAELGGLDVAVRVHDFPVGGVPLAAGVAQGQMPGQGWAD